MTTGVTLYRRLFCCLILLSVDEQKEFCAQCTMTVCRLNTVSEIDKIIAMHQHSAITVAQGFDDSLLFMSQQLGHSHTVISRHALLMLSPLLVTQ